MPPADHSHAADADLEAPPQAPSIDPAEVARFSAMAKEWWSPTGKMRPLHWLNPVRLKFIRDNAERHFGLKPGAGRPLEGLRVLDVGCGGGLLCEPLARLGAHIVGLDAGIANIKAASVHAQEGGLKIDYRAGSIEAFVASDEEKFDIVLTMEVVEHVNNPAVFLAACAAMLKPGGLLFMASINRTPKALALTIIGAEYLLRWLPVGTHTFEKFVRPEEADAALVKAGLETGAAIGVSFNPLTGQWRLSGDLSVNYMLTARAV
ncbi:MAG: bifunctional 2-polyprenyl-6-hydroxyphenol methylase/3-demethylubiquinol 3-O-methyltransferase UbiG [Caulobacterales bacterium]